MKTRRSALIVEDDDGVGRTIRRAVSSMIDHVDQVGNGLAAIDRLASRAYDYVICDYNIPGPTGLDVARYVRAHSPATYLLIVSGYLDEETEEALADIDAAILMKPFRLNEIRSFLSLGDLDGRKPVY